MSQKMESDLNTVPPRDVRHPKIHVNKHLLIADSRLEAKNVILTICVTDCLYQYYFTYISSEMPYKNWKFACNVGTQIVLEI